MGGWVGGWVGVYTGDGVHMCIRTTHKNVHVSHCVQKIMCNHVQTLYTTADLCEGAAWKGRGWVLYLLLQVLEVLLLSRVLCVGEWCCQ